MTEGPTSHHPEENSGFRTLTISIGETTYKRLLMAMQVSSASSAEELVGTSLKEFLHQLELAYCGTVLRQVNTQTLDSGPYPSRELENAFEYGEFEREQAQANPPVQRPIFTTVQGGKA